MSRPEVTCVEGEPFTADDVWDPSAVVLVVGLRGSGKTSLILQELLEPNVLERMFLLDPEDEFTDGALTLERFDQLTKSWPDEAPREFIAAVGNIDTEELAPKVWRWVRLLEARARDSVIVVDEAGVVEISKRAGMAFNHLAARSRHWRCPLVFVAQRAAQVPTTVRSQATVIVSFAQSSVADIEALEERFALRAPQLVGKIQELNRYEYVIWRLWDEPSNSSK